MDVYVPSKISPSLGVLKLKEYSWVWSKRSLTGIN